MKIYYQYSSQKTLAPIKGDLISEINLLMTLEKFADVYYSGTLFNSQVTNYGLYNYPEKIEERMNKREYDLYYLRANRNCFDAVPVGKPKTWLSAPFDKHCFENATMITTFSETLTKAIKAGNNLEWIPKVDRGKAYKNVVTTYQTVEERFCPLQDHPNTKAIRRSLDNKFIIGHFGKITRSNYPYAFLKILPELIKKHKVRFLIGSTKIQLNTVRSREIVKRGFGFNKMPYAISACDMIMLSTWGVEWDYSGCRRVLEAAACGVPIVLGDSPARREFFGDKYPLFVPSFNKGIDIYSKDEPSKALVAKDGERLMKIFDKIIPAKGKRLEIGGDLRLRAQRFLTSNYAKELEKILLKITNHVNSNNCGDKTPARKSSPGVKRTKKVSQRNTN